MMVYVVLFYIVHALCFFTYGSFLRDVFLKRDSRYRALKIVIYFMIVSFFGYGFAVTTYTLISPDIEYPDNFMSMFVLLSYTTLLAIATFFALPFYFYKLRYRLIKPSKTRMLQSLKATALTLIFMILVVPALVYFPDRVAQAYWQKQDLLQQELRNKKEAFSRKSQSYGEKLDPLSAE